MSFEWIWLFVGYSVMDCGLYHCFSEFQVWVNFFLLIIYFCISIDQLCRVTGFITILLHKYVLCLGQIHLSIILCNLLLSPFVPSISPVTLLLLSCYLSLTHNLHEKETRNSCFYVTRLFHGFLQDTTSFGGQGRL